MDTERNVAFHEAGHTVVAWFFGLRPTSVTIEPDGARHGLSTHDRSQFQATLPGLGLIRSLVDASVRVVEMASGGCSELKLGTDHEKCGWSGDLKEFEQHLNVISSVTGWSYDHSWNLTSAMAKEILAQPDVWTLVEELAARLLEATSLSEDELCVFFAGRVANGRGAITNVVRLRKHVAGTSCCASAEPSVSRGRLTA